MWRPIYEGDLLLITGGADEMFSIEDVAPDVAREVVALSEAVGIVPEQRSPAAQAIIEQLLTAGIVRFPTPATARRVALRWIGTRDAALCARLNAGLHDRSIDVTDADHADVEIFIRTNGRLRDLLDGDYSSLTTPHILIDLAYHHVCSVGPLVFPGDTACLGCLVGRLSTYWGDAPPPDRPRMIGHSELAAGIAVLEAERVIDGDDSLINVTLAYDFGQRTVRSSRLFKLPWCPMCGQTERAGSLRLPWTEAQCSGS